jgi:hypothetical protein
MRPQEAHDLIREACLRRPELSYWRPDERQLVMAHNYRGFCYIASQVFAYLTGAEVWAVDTGEHYWNVLDGEIWDLTKEQFNFKYNYNGYKVPRKNKLTARAKELLEETKLELKNK